MQAQANPDSNGEVSSDGEASTDAVLVIINVRFGYADLIAVWDVSFEAYAGALTAIVGRNGAGKTTLMFGLAGVIPTMGGSVLLAGSELSSVPSWNRAAGLCLVPEGKRVFRELTVEDNLTIALPRGVPAADRRERCQEVYERFPILYDRRGQLAGSLSGGQQQMLAISTALVMRPQVLLVDEPSSGLAPAAVELVWQTLTELKATGMAIVLVEQTVEDIMTGMADEVLVIEGGRVVMRDVPERISIRDLEQRLSVG